MDNNCPFGIVLTLLEMKKKLPKSEDLIRCINIFNSHEDFQVYEAVYAGYDEDWNLVIICEYTDCDAPQYDCGTYAILNKHEALRLAGRLKVPLIDLPLEIAESMSEWNEIVCPLPSHVEDCFKDITECLLDEGCRFKICRKSARNGYIAC